MHKLLSFILLFCSPLIFGQQLETVDFTKIEATITPDLASKSIKGTVTVKFQILKNTNKVYLDAVDMYHPSLDAYEDGGIEVYYSEHKIWLHSDFEAGYEYQITFDYTATPKQTLYFTYDQIWTQGQGKYTSHWLPSIDDMNDKIEFDISVKTTDSYTVISNGVLAERFTQVERLAQFKKKYPSVAIDSVMNKEGIAMNNTAVYAFNMEHPMSSYLVAFALGNFKQLKTASKSGIPLEMYFRPEDSLKAEPTYRHTKVIFDFLEEEIGVPYPWQDYKQVPVRDFLYAGMENTSCTFFSEAFVIDETGFNDRHYVNVNAHELAHQWFGNFVTETSSEHHWLHEGFATYYALLAEREIFGEQYYYWKLFQSAEQLKALSDEGKGQSLRDPKASSLTFYEKGAWALHVLRERIGDEAFQGAIKRYLTANAYKNVTIEDFTNAIRQETTITIDDWEKDWLQQTAFQSEQAYASLVKSQFMNNYFEIAALRATAIEEKSKTFERVFTFPNDYIAQEAVYQLALEPIQETMGLYKKAFDTKNLMVRQAIVSSFDKKIPTPLINDFMSLLNDDSYVTQEAAMYLLWQNSNVNPVDVLNKMDGVVGFQNRNVRQLWLVLSLVTEGYRIADKKEMLEELRSYSHPKYSFEVRELAFNYLFEINQFSETEILNLANAMTHHNWRFKKFSRELMLRLAKEDGLKISVKELLPKFPKAVQAYLEDKL
ncbi:M1 family metallopeptidase [Patiriisocius marinus]|uniref:Aminopeptidase N n=1 Tax=Patiriisocius marinus TaxID=1397112 RepID=A0A5J4J5E1_9FLAO|nr:M1 family metallopeptidase [Patiriisocius marinus]GER61021.1 aminopeptidase [Patiriisocius marinus]